MEFREIIKFKHKHAPLRKEWINAVDFKLFDSKHPSFVFFNGISVGIMKTLLVCKLFNSNCQVNIWNYFFPDWTLWLCMFFNRNYIICIEKPPCGILGSLLRPPSGGQSLVWEKDLNQYNYWLLVHMTHECVNINTMHFVRWI